VGTDSSRLDDRDLFALHLGQAVVNAVGTAAATNVSTQMHVIGEHDVCRVHVRPCGFPVDATVALSKKAGFERQEFFYVRVDNATRALAAEERARYIAGRTRVASGAEG
jgi:hypothetical protein